MVSKWDFIVLVSGLEVCCIHCSVQGFYRGLNGSPGSVLPCNGAGQMEMWLPLNTEASQQNVWGLVDYSHAIQIENLIFKEALDFQMGL